MRLIDADALMDNIKLDAKKAIEEDDKVGSFWLGYAAGLVIKEPTIQPEPQEGHWIWVAGELMCSECCTIYSDLYPDYDNAVACPHCGARMKGEKHETD